MIEINPYLEKKKKNFFLVGVVVRTMDSKGESSNAKVFDSLKKILKDLTEDQELV